MELMRRNGFAPSVVVVAGVDGNYEVIGMPNSEWRTLRSKMSQELIYGGSLSVWYSIAFSVYARYARRT